MTPVVFISTTVVIYRSSGCGRGSGAGADSSCWEREPPSPGPDTEPFNINLTDCIMLWIMRHWKDVLYVKWIKYVLTTIESIDNKTAVFRFFCRVQKALTDFGIFVKHLSVTHQRWPPRLMIFLRVCISMKQPFCPPSKTGCPPIASSSSPSPLLETHPRGSLFTSQSSWLSTIWRELSSLEPSLSASG